MAAAGEKRGGLEARISAPEKAAAETEGQTNVFKWLAHHAGWFVAIIGAALAALGLKAPPHLP